MYLERCRSADQHEYRAIRYQRTSPAPTHTLHPRSSPPHFRHYASPLICGSSCDFSSRHRGVITVDRSARFTPRSAASLARRGTGHSARALWRPRTCASAGSFTCADHERRGWFAECVSRPRPRAPRLPRRTLRVAFPMTRDQFRLRRPKLLEWPTRIAAPRR